MGVTEKGEALNVERCDDAHDCNARDDTGWEQSWSAWGKVHLIGVWKDLTGGIPCFCIYRID